MKTIKEKDVSNLKKQLKQCININNAYLIKHNELLFVYNAYKKLLKQKSSKTDMNIEINKLIKKYEMISEEELICMIKQQQEWMTELHSININVDEIINIHSVIDIDNEMKKYGL